MMNMMLGFLSAAVAGSTDMAKSSANATIQKTKVSLVDVFIFSSPFSFPKTAIPQARHFCGLQITLPMVSGELSTLQSQNLLHRSFLDPP
jgi:hypothetical protein